MLLSFSLFFVWIAIIQLETISKPEGHITFFALLIHTAYPTEGSSDNSIHGFFYPPFGIKSTGMNSPLLQVSFVCVSIFELLEKQLADG
jgi:hypothetical protein